MKSSRSVQRRNSVATFFCFVFAATSIIVFVQGYIDKSSPMKWVALGLFVVAMLFLWLIRPEDTDADD